LREKYRAQEIKKFRISTLGGMRSGERGDSELLTSDVAYL